MQKVFWTQGAKVLLHWCKRELHRCQTGFGWCKKLLGDLCPLGPRHLLHPLLTTLGTFEVSGPCSRHSGSQAWGCDPGRHLQECPVARAGNCPKECFSSGLRHLARSILFWRGEVGGAQSTGVSQRVRVTGRDESHRLFKN